MPAKTKPKITAIPPRQFGPVEAPHWFKVLFSCRGSYATPIAAQGEHKSIEPVKLTDHPDSWGFIYSIRIFALNARDAHYQLSIQMEALGWSEGQNWRVTMICPEETK